jgi:hypothetical protein
LGCAVVNSATESDALSTGVLLGSENEIEKLGVTLPNLRYVQARLAGTRIEYLSRGIDLMAENQTQQ